MYGLPVQLLSQSSTPYAVSYADQHPTGEPVETTVTTALR